MMSFERRQRRSVWRGVAAALISTLVGSAPDCVLAAGVEPASNSASVAPITLRPIPPEVLSRYQKLTTLLVPSAKLWAEEQARLELKRPAPDIAALNAAIHRRFKQPNTPGASTATNGAGVGGDAAEMAVVIILMMVQDGDQDLQQKMLQAENQMQANLQASPQASPQAKAFLKLWNEVNSAIASVSVGDRKNPNTPCVTPQCRSLPDDISAYDKIIEPGPLPWISWSGGFTYANLQVLKGRLVAGFGEKGIGVSGPRRNFLNVRVAVMRRARYLDLVSNLEKKIREVPDSAIANFK